MSLPTPFPPVYPISPDSFRGADLMAWAAALAAEGCRLLQYRRKSGPDGETLAELSALLDLLRPSGCRVIVDDRPDLCLLAGAHGVHLGQDDLPPTDTRSLLGPHKIIGYSTHTVEQAREAIDLPVDYIALGPVFPTETKAHPEPVVSVAEQEAVLRAARVPVVAIGGITPATAGDLRRRGFAGLAVISALERDTASAWRRLLAVAT